MLSLVGDGEDCFAVVFHHVFDDLGSGVAKNDIGFLIMVERGKNAALCILGAVSSVDANTGKTGTFIMSGSGFWNRLEKFTMQS
jgi:hypothetical protein